MTDVQQAVDARIADLMRAGRVRVALYPPQYAKDPATGELRGWTIELALALAARMGLSSCRSNIQLLLGPLKASRPTRAMRDSEQWTHLGLPT